MNTLPTTKTLTTETGVLDEFVDDAIHIIDPDERSSTLCAQDRVGLNTVEMDDQRGRDWGAGCWTCIEEAATADAGARVR